MKILYIKDFTGHVAGHIIDTDRFSAKFLIDKGVCVEHKETVVEQSATVTETPVVEKKEKIKVVKKGRPSKK